MINSSSLKRNIASMFVHLSLSLFIHVHLSFFLSLFLSCPLYLCHSSASFHYYLAIYLFFSLSLSYIFWFCYFQRRITPTPPISFTLINDMDSSSSSQNWLGFSLSNDPHQHPSSLSLFHAFTSPTQGPLSLSLSLGCRAEAAHFYAQYI